jgi:hypothetical protein
MASRPEVARIASPSLEILRWVLLYRERGLLGVWFAIWHRRLRELLRHGASTWQLWLFGAVTIPLGLWLWHGQGRHFGFGPEAKVITWRDALPVLLTALALVVLGVLIDGR